MKKKLLTIVLSLVCAVVCVFAFVACGNGNGGTNDGNKHSHSAQSYDIDENAHWKICAECGEKFDSGNHRVNASGICGVCGYVAVYTQGLEYSPIQDEDNENIVAYAVGGIGTATDTDIVLPSYHEGKPVTSIGNDTFRNCINLTSIEISDSVTQIGSWAFYDCSGLTSIEIPDSVTQIGSSAFYGCGKLIQNNNGVSYVGKWAVYCDGAWEKDSVVTSVALRQNTVGIADNSFGRCYSLMSISLPLGLKYIGSEAFEFCNKITEISIPNSVTSIGEESFHGCSSLTSIMIPNSVTSIGDYAFCDCSSLTSVTIPNGVTSIGDGVFRSCSSLTSITIPNSVTSIGDYAFCDCGSLTSVTIPSDVTSIGSVAFYGTNLTDVTYNGDIKGWCKLDGLEFLMQYGSNEKSLTIGGKKIAGSLIIPNGVTIIGDNAFLYCKDITGIIIPDTVSSIGGRAFENTTYYNDENNWENGSLYIGKHLIRVINTETDLYSVKQGTLTIAGGAFLNCNKLTSIEISDGVTNIGAGAFWNCSKLTNIKIPNSVKSIEMGAFYKCSSLTDINLPNGMSSIEDGLFSDCSSLSKIIIPNGVTSIGESAFEKCSSLTSITIPNSVMSIGDGVFRSCSGLTSITIPNSVTSIGNGAFSSCSSLTNITIPNGVTSIGSGAFYGCGSLSIYCEDPSMPSGWNENWNLYNNTGSYSYLPVVWDCKRNDRDEDGYAYTILNGVRYRLKDRIADVVDQSISISEAIIPSNILYKNESYSVINIDAYAFSGCSKLTRIEIPNSVISIGHSAFYGTAYYNNENNWGNGVLYIGNHLIRANNTIRGTYTIKQGTISIASGAFGGCSNLTSLEIPNSVTSIGDDAFYNCSSLTSLEIPNSVTSIGDDAFNYCRFSIIVFNGTKEQWKTIGKWTNGNIYADYTVICTDGELDKKGNEITE